MQRRVLYPGRIMQSQAVSEYIQARRSVGKDNYCAAQVRCAYSEQTYSAPLNACLDPVCDDRILASFDPSTHACGISPLMAPCLIILLLALVVGELFSNYMYG